MNRLTITLSSLALFAVTACGGGDSATGSFNDYVAAQDQAISKICSCTDDVAACEAMYSITEAEKTCIRGVIAENDTPELIDALDCQAAAASDYYACINPIACDDMTTAFEDCGTAYETTVDACPAIPAAVDTAVESTCYPE